jgi:hypothetical protein
MELYRGGTQMELEDALADWLRREIGQLEKGRGKNVSNDATVSDESLNPAVTH